MFLKWRATGILLSGIAFAFFLVQHVAFGLGGLLVALFDEGYRYQNLDGEYFYADGLARLVVVNLVALYAGLAGVYAAFAFGRIFGLRSRRPASEKNENSLSAMIKIHHADLRRICFIFLGTHALITMIQVYAMYGSVDEIFNYGVQVLVKFTPGVFLIVGVLLPYDRRVCWVVLIYISFYALLQLSAGGRAPILYALIMLLIGALYAAPGWLLTRRKIIVMIGAAVILPWLVIQSENVRYMAGSRIPTSFEDLSQRIDTLFFAEKTPSENVWGYEYRSSLSNSLFRFGARTAEVSVLDILNKTPEEIPYRGWTHEDSFSMLSSLIPVGLASDISEERFGGVMILRNYGWAVDPAGGTSFPLTLLGDSWIREGWLGVIAFHFIWAGLLTMIPSLLGQRRNKLLGIVSAGPIFYITIFSYTNDIVGVLGALPRLLIMAIACSTFFYLIGIIRISRHRR